MTSTLARNIGLRGMDRPESKGLAIDSGYLDGFPLDLGVSLEKLGRARGWTGG